LIRWSRKKRHGWIGAGLSLFCILWTWSTCFIFFRDSKLFRFDQKRVLWLATSVRSRCAQWKSIPHFTN
jgi:hypothetical protein